MRAALAPREREQGFALSAAATSLERELREIVAGLLLETQLTLTEPGGSPQLSERLTLILELAVSLRQKLDKTGMDKTDKLVPPQAIRAQQKRQPAPAAFSV